MTRLAPGGFAPDVDVRDSEGQAGRLSDYWKRRPIVLLLTRHSGCTFCRQQLLDARDRHADYERAGVDVVAVTMGTVEQARELRKSLGLNFPLLSDPELLVYQAYGAERGSWWQVAGPQVWLPGLMALPRRGLGKIVGDVRQLHAAFVISKDGLLLFAHYPTNSADQADTEGVLQTCAIGVPRPGSEGPR